MRALSKTEKEELLEKVRAKFPRIAINVKVSPEDRKRLEMIREAERHRPWEKVCGSFTG